MNLHVIRVYYIVKTGCIAFSHDITARLSLEFVDKKNETWFSSFHRFDDQKPVIISMIFLFYILKIHFSTCKKLYLISSVLSILFFIIICSLWWHRAKYTRHVQVYLVIVHAIFSIIVNIHTIFIRQLTIEFPCKFSLRLIIIKIRSSTDIRRRTFAWLFSSRNIECAHYTVILKRVTFLFLLSLLLYNQETICLYRSEIWK